MEQGKVLAFVVTLAVIITSYLLFQQFSAPQTVELYASLNVSSTVGVDVNSTALTFGSIPPGGTSVRNVVVSNTDGYDRTASFGIEGDIGRFVRLPQDTLVKAHSNASIAIRADVPSDATDGSYAGKLKITLRRAI
jgi:hypothetical protein